MCLLFYSIYVNNSCLTFWKKKYARHNFKLFLLTVHQITWIKCGQYIDIIYSERVFAKMDKIILIFLPKNKMSRG